VGRTTGEEPPGHWKNHRNVGSKTTSKCLREQRQEGV
jgi:hypothetical protein